jgi:hypothetical protein
LEEKLTVESHAFKELEREHHLAFNKAKISQVEKCGSYQLLKQDENNYILQKILDNDKYLKEFRNGLSTIAVNTLKLTKDIDTYKLFPNYEHAKKIYKKYLSTKKATHYVPYSNNKMALQVKEALKLDTVKGDLFDKLRGESFSYLLSHLSRFEKTEQGGIIVKKILDNQGDLKSLLDVLGSTSSSTRKTSLTGSSNDEDISENTESLLSD